MESPITVTFGDDQIGEKSSHAITTEELRVIEEWWRDRSEGLGGEKRVPR